MEKRSPLPIENSWNIIQVSEQLKLSQMQSIAQYHLILDTILDDATEGNVAFLVVGDPFGYGSF